MAMAVTQVARLFNGHLRFAGGDPGIRDTQMANGEGHFYWGRLYEHIWNIMKVWDDDHCDDDDDDDDDD